jgi:signal peptidase I
LRYLLHAFIVVALALNVTPTLYRVFTGRRLHVHVVKSRSMIPALRRGDLVISRSPDDDLREGEIILYKNVEGTTIIHRVLETRREEDDIIFVTKGDASPDMDPPVNKEEVHGVLVLRIPMMGYPFLWLSSSS